MIKFNCSLRDVVEMLACIALGLIAGIGLGVVYMLRTGGF